MMLILEIAKQITNNPKLANIDFVVKSTEWVEFQLTVKDQLVSLKYEQTIDRLSILYAEVLPQFIKNKIKNYGFNQAGRYQVVKVNQNNPKYLLEMISELLIDIHDYVANSNTEKEKNSHQLMLINGNYKDDENNSIEAPESLHNCRFLFKGSGNQIFIHPEANLRNTTIQFVGNNAKVHIGKAVRMTGNWRLGHNCYLTIKDRSSSTNAVYITCAEGTGVTIGEDCMFATSNQIRTDDAHAIFDVNTGQRINYSQDITVGNHVWVAYGATVFGGSQIGSGSIVGAFSLTNKHYPNNCIIAGTPGKVVRKDVCWERPNVLYESEPKMYIEKNKESEQYYQITNADSTS